MTIETIDLIKKSTMSGRIDNNSTYTSSISIDHTTSMVIASCPTENSVKILDQKLTSTVKGPVTNILQYGDLDFPICSRIDSTRNSIWIADTGNNSIIKVNFSFDYILSIDDIKHPYCLHVNPNNGSIVVRHYTGSLDTISCFNKSGEKIWSFVTDITLPDFSETENYIESLPLQNSIKIDHVRNNCWIASKTNIIKINLWSNNSCVFHIDNYISVKDNVSIDVDYDSGNPKIFVTETDRKQKTGIIELSENNDAIFSYNSIDRTSIKCGLDIIIPSTSSSQILLQGFKNPMARGTWNKYTPNRPDNSEWYKSGLAPYDIENPIVGTPWAAYGSFQNQTFVTYYMYENSSTNLTDIWRYKKDKSVTNLYNGVNVTPNEISGLYRLDYFNSAIGNTNPFPNDFGYVIESGKYAPCNCDYDITTAEYDSYYATFPYKGFT